MHYVHCIQSRQTHAWWQIALSLLPNRGKLSPNRNRIQSRAARLLENTSCDVYGDITQRVSVHAVAYRIALSNHPHAAGTIITIIYSGPKK